MILLHMNMPGLIISAVLLQNNINGYITGYLYPEAYQTRPSVLYQEMISHKEKRLHGRGQTPL